MELIPSDTGLVLRLSGFSQYLSNYFEDLLQVMNEFRINGSLLEEWKTELKHEYYGIIDDLHLLTTSVNRSLSFDYNVCSIYV